MDGESGSVRAAMLTRLICKALLRIIPFHFLKKDSFTLYAYVYVSMSVHGQKPEEDIGSLYAGISGIYRTPIL